MKKFNFLLVIPLFYFSTFLHAQEKDSSYYSKLGMHYYEASEHYLETDIDSCIILSQLAADHFEKAENWFYYVMSTIGVGGAYFHKGDNRKAFKYLEKAKLASQDKLGQVICPVLINYGSSYQRMGQYDLSLDYFYQALEQCQDSPNPYVEPILLQYIGLNFKTKGDLTKAIQYLNQSLEIGEEFREDSIYFHYHINNLISLADCYGLNMQFDKEKALLFSTEKNLSSYGEAYETIRDKNLIQIYTQLSEIYLEQNQPDSSKLYVDKALQFQEDDLKIEKSFSYNLLGQIARKENNLPLAIRHFQEAKSIALLQHESFPYHRDIAEADLMLAETYFAQGDYDQSIDHYQKALLALCPDAERLENLNNPEPIAFTAPNIGLQILKSKAEALIQIANAKKQSDYYDEALNTYLVSTKCVVEIRKTFNSEKAKQLLGGDVLSIYENAIVLAYERFQATEDKKYLKWAFSFAEKNKANLILASLQEDNALGQGGIPDKLLKQENSLKIEINYFKRKIQDSEYTQENNPKMLALWKTSLLELEQQYDDLQRQFERDFPKYYQLKYDYPELELADFQAKIPNVNTLLLEYFMGEKNQFLFAIQKNEVRIYPLSLEDAFAGKVQKLNTILSQPPNSQNFQEHLQQLASLSQQLYQQLIPFSINKGLDQLLIVPDDVLHYLPFEILCKAVKENPRSFSISNFEYLIKDYSVYYAYSLTLWYQTLQKKSVKASKKWVGFAPSFKAGNNYAQRACSMDELYDLRCSKEEVSRIHSILGGDIFLGKEANKERFQRIAKDYQIIHLATHACIDQHNGDLNRIFLTDDFLDNNDLSNYQLNAELAVLSACNTGSGELLKGEGIYSLSRGLIMAGVPSTLTTLWSVDDCSTSALMQGFYQYLADGKTKSDALRQAKLDHLENAELVNTHPYFWAAFIQSGNPKALKNKEINSWWLSSLFALFLLLWAYWRRKKN